MQVVIDPPRLDLAPRVLGRQELTRVQTPVAKLPVGRLDEIAFNRLSGSDDVEQHTATMCPRVRSPRGNLGPVIGMIDPGLPCLPNHREGDSGRTRKCGRMARERHRGSRCNARAGAEVGEISAVRNPTRALATTSRKPLLPPLHGQNDGHSPMRFGKRPAEQPDWDRLA
jgi:hypothetical protein